MTNTCQRLAAAHGATAEEVIAKLVSSVDAGEQRLIVYFASAQHSLAAIAAAMHTRFERADVLGCSTAGEIVSGQLLEGSIAAMALPASVVSRAACVLLEDLSDPEAVSQALRQLGDALGAPVASLDLETHVGLVLFDGLSGAEERILEKLGDLADIPFVGGSAGDDLQFRSTAVCLNGREFSGAAVLAVLQVPAGYEIIKTQSFRSLGKKLVATSVDEGTRTVHSFNGEPAIAAYAAALGVPVETIDQYFMLNPLGLIVEGEPYVRSPQRTLPDGGIAFFCQIREGMELEVLQGGDMVRDTAVALKALGGNVSGLLVFNCILRTLALRREGACQAFGALFEEIPAAGFSTYGEAYLGHINQTAIMLALR